MQGIALVIAAVNVILRHLDALPDGPEVRELRATALGYINEVMLWTTTLPSIETRDALMKKVLALHVSVSRHQSQAGGDRGPFIARERESARVRAADPSPSGA
jgi:hypothetical protein